MDPDSTKNLSHERASAEPANGAVTFDSNKNTAMIPSLIVWFSAIIAILMTAFFFLANSSIAGQIDSKSAEKSKVTAALVSADATGIEAAMTSFSGSVKALKAAQAKAYPMQDTMSEIFAKVDQDVKLTSMSLNDSGKFTMIGTTTSYHSAAQQVMTFKGWKVKGNFVMTNVELGSVSLTTTKTGQVSVPISITADFSNPAKMTTVVPSDVSIQGGSSAASN
ncbi:MAG: hypothetical protein NTW50_02780 [Candidatus Berkelbacteria bacterium]|nr:hypothetical protein [Candidatus Berkelbacteria bacterium]